MDDSTLFLAACGTACLLIGAFFVLVVWAASREARLEADLIPRPASARPKSAHRLRRPPRRRR